VNDESLLGAECRQPKTNVSSSQGRTAGYIRGPDFTNEPRSVLVGRVALFVYSDLISTSSPRYTQALKLLFDFFKRALFR